MSQTYFSLMNPKDNINNTHLLFTLYYLFKIFMEFEPNLFKINKGSGRPRNYTADIMVPFIQWGHINNIFSCRDLENWWTRNDDTCNFILNCKKPSKTTINECENIYGKIIMKFDKFIVDFALQIGLMEGNIIYNDGTILKAYCNNANKLYANQISILKDFILKHKNKTDKTGLWYKLDKYFNNNEFKEDVEPVLDDLKKSVYAGGISLLKSIFTSKNGLKKVLGKIKQMEENIKGKLPVNIVDPEAHLMLDKDEKWCFGYNYQVACDDKCGMIFLHYITQSPNDKKELLRVVKELNERIGREDYVIVVDNGYWHIQTLKEIYHSPTNIIIPYGAAATRKKEEIKKEINGHNDEMNFKKHKFIRNFENDTYTCPNENILTRQNNIVQNGIEYKVYATKDCLDCIYQDSCTSEPIRKIKDRADIEIEEIKKAYDSKEGQEIYSKRGSYAEGIFGTLLESRNFRGIKTRGTDRVNLEITLCTITHNIKKIHKHVNNNVLKTILKIVKREKKKNKQIKIEIIGNLIKNFIIKDDKIIDLELK